MTLHDMTYKHLSQHSGYPHMRSSYPQKVSLKSKILIRRKNAQSFSYDIIYLGFEKGIITVLIVYYIVINKRAVNLLITCTVLNIPCQIFLANESSTAKKSINLNAQKHVRIHTYFWYLHAYCQLMS